MGRTKITLSLWPHAYKKGDSRLKPSCGTENAPKLYPFLLPKIVYQRDWTFCRPYCFVYFVLPAHVRCQHLTNTLLHYIFAFSLCGPLFRQLCLPQDREEGKRRLDTHVQNSAKFPGMPAADPVLFEVQCQSCSLMLHEQQRSKRQQATLLGRLWLSKLCF